MKKCLFLISFFLFFRPSLSAQRSFELDSGVEREKIKFELVNNLIIVPIELNGILGGDFLKDFILEINYMRKFIRLYALGEPKKSKEV